MAALAVLALLVTLWSAERAMNRASATVIRGEAELLVNEVDTDIASAPWALTADDLDAVLAAHKSEGLRYIAIVDESGTVSAEAGDSTIPTATPSDWRLDIEGKRARLAARIPPPPHEVSGGRDDEHRHHFDRAPPDGMPGESHGGPPGPPPGENGLPPPFGGPGFPHDGRPLGDRPAGERPPGDRGHGRPPFVAIELELGVRREPPLRGDANGDRRRARAFGARGVRRRLAPERRAHPIVRTPSRSA